MAKVSQAYAFVEQTLKKGDYAQVHVASESTGARVSPSFLDQDDSYPAGRRVWAPFGKHNIRVTAKGYKPKLLAVDVSTANATGPAAPPSWRRFAPRHAETVASRRPET